MDDTTDISLAPPARLLDLIVAQNKALELALHNEPLGAVLEVMAHAAERHVGKGCVAAILLVDPTGTCLRHGAAPSLPSEYCRAIDGVPIGPNVGTCGAAAARKETIVTADIAQDPNWLPYRDLALSYGLRAAWSRPILSSSGDVLGTFGLYYREVKDPEPAAREIVDLLTQTAALLIERHSVHGRTARRLDEQRERLIHTFSRIAAVVGIVRGPDHRYEFVNDEFRRVVGDRDYVGHPLREVVPEVQSQEILQILDQVYRTGIFVEGKEHRVDLHSDDGSLRVGYFNFRFEPFFDQFGAVEGVVQTAVEVTEQVLARQSVEAAKAALVVEKKNLRSLFEESPYFFCEIAGPDLRFDYVNPAHRAIFGGKNFTGMTVREAQPELEGSGFIELLEGVLRTGKPTIVPESPGMIGDEEHFFDLIFVPRRNGLGEVDGILALGMDITDRVQAIRSRDEFLSIASHELKTPLTALNLQAQMSRRTMQRSPDGQLSPEKIERLVLHAENSVKRLMRLVDDMLDIARLSTGKLTLQPERFDLCSVVRAVVERFAPEAEAAETRITFTETDEVWGEWDLFRIEQVTSNFISNALRYGRNSPIEVRVDRPTPTTVRLSVQDWGPGIAQENHERIFRRFERADGSKSLSGLGLGLSICREIIGQHGGEVGLESIPGSGATFYAVLPLTAPPVEV